MFFDLFSKRGASSEHLPVKDEEIPKQFRAQVVHILNHALSSYYPDDPYAIYGQPVSNKWWKFIHDTFCREKGIFFMANQHYSLDRQCKEFVLSGSPEDVLDLIDICFMIIDTAVRNTYEQELRDVGVQQSAQSAIEELNLRLRAHDLPFQFDGGQLIRTDSEYLHAEVTRPAIELLKAARFQGPLQEFLVAHEHYRHDRKKDAIAGACKAFESTMKGICDERNWDYSNASGAAALIGILVDNGFIPSYLDSHLTALRTALQSGVPTVGNRTSRHGQGKEPTDVAESFASFALNLAACNIVFLMKLHHETRQ